MDYLTKYYKNLAESLQQKLNILQSQLDESIMPERRPIKLPSWTHVDGPPKMPELPPWVSTGPKKGPVKAKGEIEKTSKKLDPVGEEDGDIDNDGDKDSTDKYLLNRRKAIGDAMGRKG